MKKRIKTLMKGNYSFSIILLLALSSGISNAQDITGADTTRNNALKVFIDCQTCDMNYIKVQMPYIIM
jgi:hypothetical protein